MATFQTRPGNGGLLYSLPEADLAEQPKLHFVLGGNGRANGLSLRHGSGRRVLAVASLTTAAHRTVDWPSHWQSAPLGGGTATSVPTQHCRIACNGVSVQQLQQCQVQTTAVRSKQSQQQQQSNQPSQDKPHGTHRPLDAKVPLKSCQNGLLALLTSLEQAKLLVAGAMSAVVSRTAMAPLERVKMDLLLKTSSRSALQTAVWVYEREGVAGFWKGNALNLLRTAPFKALNFFSFDMYSKALGGMMADGNNSARFLAGALAGVTATLVCFPLDVLRTRLMAPYGHKYGGPLHTLAGMVRFEGLGALYAGCVPAVIGMAPSGAVFYGVYDLLKHNHLEALNNQQASPASLAATAAAVGSSRSILQQQQRLDLPVLYTLLYGAVAGAASETILYPLEVIRRKMQLQSMVAGAAVIAGRSAATAVRQHGLKAAAGALLPAHSCALGTAAAPGAAFARIAAACTAIVQADGIAGFYAGLLPNMLQVLPSAALSYGTYESVKNFLGVVA